MEVSRWRENPIIDTSEAQHFYQSGETLRALPTTLQEETHPYEACFFDEVRSLLNPRAYTISGNLYFIFYVLPFSINNYRF